MLFPLLIFILSLVTQLYYYFKFSMLANYDGFVAETPTIPVSIIIAAKNEGGNLEKYLAEVLNQDYERFEVLVVNDNSTDETKDILKGISNSNLRLIDQKSGLGKKDAIKLGISKAKYEHLVFTDADCRPTSDQWLKKITAGFANGKDIVLGYGSFYKKSGLLNKIIRFEGLLNAIQYFSFALAGKPYMGVGRNLAYTKSIYLKSKAFQKHSKLKSGDDDLLVNEVATTKNTAVCVAPESHTVTNGKERWVDYFHQRRRQLQVGEYYKISDRIRLMFFGLSSLFFYIFYIALMCFGEDQIIYSLLFVSKLLLQLIIFRKIMANLGDRDLLKWIPILEFVYFLQISLIGISVWTWKVNRWK